MPDTNPTPNPYSTILERFGDLTEDDRRQLLRELTAMVDQDAKKDLSPLEKAWEEVHQYLLKLSREPYIDDQIELYEIWDICDILRDDPDSLKKETWEVRQKVILEILAHDEIKNVVVSMEDLLYLLAVTDEEKRWMAEHMVDRYGYMTQDGIKILLDLEYDKKKKMTAQDQA
ncbi:MAG: hypothetical protein IJ083_17145 [Clostridia bacterium]|nr:hypothetical protein [Clostridia bacterium]